MLEPSRVLVGTPSTMGAGILNANTSQIQIVGAKAKAILKKGARCYMRSNAWITGPGKRAGSACRCPVALRVMFCGGMFGYPGTASGSPCSANPIPPSVRYSNPAASRPVNGNRQADNHTL